MCVHGTGSPHGIQQEQHLRHAGEEVLPADGVRDAHVGVIHGVGQQEHRRTVGPPDDEVLEVVGGERHLAAHDVIEGHGCTRRHAEAHGQAIHHGRPVHLAVLGITEVGMPAPQQVLHHLAVTIAPFRLEVRALVPVQAQPLQLGQQAVGEVAAVPLGVGVLDPEHEGATHRTGVQPVEQCRPGASDVQETGGRWCEADSRCHRAEATGEPATAIPTTGIGVGHSGQAHDRPPDDAGDRVDQEFVGDTPPLQAMLVVGDVGQHSNHDTG